MNKSSSHSKSRMGTVAAVLALCLAGSAMAHDGPQRDHDRRDDQGSRHAQRFDSQRHYGGGFDRRDDRGAYRYRQVDPRMQAQWQRGGYLPQAYRRQPMHDWRAYQLQQPPSGYQWVSANGDFVLAAIAGGLIAQIVAGR